MDSTKKGNSAGTTDRPHRAKASAAARRISPASAKNHASTAHSPRQANPRHRVFIHITALPYAGGGQLMSQISLSAIRISEQAPSLFRQVFTMSRIGSDKG